MKKESILKISILVTIFVILIRIAQFQILEHKALSAKATYNFLKDYKIQPPRGKIFDRNGIMLATWKPSFRVMAIPKYLNERDYQDLANLLGGLKINPDTIKKKGNYIELKDGLNFEEVAKIFEKSLDIKTLIIDANPTRYYTDYASYASHVIGYVSEVSKDEVKRFNLEMGDYIGKMGIERTYDSLIRGVPGAKFIALDSKGNVVSTNPRPPIEPIEGESLNLTIDINLQAYADSLFQNYPRGAAIAFNIKTGEILVLYSKPYYDPRKIKENWVEYFLNPEKPLLNRVIQGLYPPGSTFKLITTLVGLKEGAVVPHTSFHCPGGFQFGRRTWLCWRTEGHGTLNLLEAISQSCNVYFNNVGARIGTEHFTKTLSNFNLPLKTEIKLPGEYSVLIPTEMLFKRFNLLPSSVINWSIGQGEIQVTPAWMALITGLIANEGKCPKPYLVKGEKPSFVSINIEKDYFKIVKEGMRLVVEGAGGTASYLYDPTLKVAGKTGTAQNPHGKEHSWFTCYFPHDDPTYVITVVVENAGHGSEAAAPIAFKLARKIRENEKR